MNKIFDFISQSPAVEAFGLSLLHSLWQGAAIAILLWINTKTLKNLQAQIRYYSALCGLLLLSSVFCLTFYFQYKQLSTPIPLQEIEILQFTAPATGFHPWPPTESEGIFQQLESTWFSTLLLIKQHSAYIFLLWSIGFIFYSSRFFIGLTWLERLKKTSIQVPQNWNKTLATLRQKTGIRRQIRLLASNKVTSPLTFGWLKPVIIFPASVLAQMPIDQVESILLHELIHIKQKDYLVSLLQSATEMLFFFNPAYWYISSVLDKERENACDDLVVNLTQNPLTYAKALSSLAAFCNRQESPPALAAAHNQQQLLFRIKRIIHPPKPNKTMKHFLKNRGYLSAPVAIFCLLVAIFTLDVKGNIQIQRLQTEKSIPQLNDTSKTQAGTEEENKILTTISKGYYQISDTDSDGTPSIATMTSDSIIIYENNSARGAGNGPGHGKFHKINPEAIQEKTQSITSFNKLLQKTSSDIEKGKDRNRNSDTDTAAGNPLILLLKSSPDPVNLETDTGEEQFTSTIRNALSEGIVIRNVQDVPAEAITSVTTIRKGAEKFFGENGRHGVMIVSVKAPSEETQIRKQEDHASIKANPLILVLDHEHSSALNKPGLPIQDIAKLALEKGLEIEDANKLDPQSIQSVQVFKSQQAAHFGESAKEGVALIVLKEGVPKPANTAAESEFIVYPNPADDLVKIKFSLPLPETVKITVHDNANNTVTTIASQTMEKGTHEFVWDASQQAPGIYIITLTQGRKVTGKKVEIR